MTYSERITAAPIYMTVLPPGSIPKVWLRDDLDLTHFHLRRGERIKAYASKTGAWKDHRALMLTEEDLCWRQDPLPSREEAIPEFWRRFHALVRERCREVPPLGISSSTSSG